MSAIPLTRPHFLKVSTFASGGLLIGFYLPESDAASIQPQPWTSLPQGAEINAWLAIDAEGNVTVRVPHTEMGQGALTSVSMMIAEELNADWTLVRRQHPHIMQVGASARERLKEAAARAWGVNRSEVVAMLGTLKACPVPCGR